MHGKWKACGKALISCFIQRSLHVLCFQRGRRFQVVVVVPHEASIKLLNNEDDEV